MCSIYLFILEIEVECSSDEVSLSSLLVKFVISFVVAYQKC